MTSPARMKPEMSSRDVGDIALARRCRATLRAVFPQPPTSVEEVRTAAEDLLGEPLEIVIGEPIGRTLASAAWVRLSTGGSVVWVDARTSPLHRIALLGHEFGHIFNRDRPVPLARGAARIQVDAVAASLASTARLSDADIAAIVGRCGEACAPGSEAWACERAAEMTGRFLAHRLLQELATSRYLLRDL